MIDDDDDCYKLTRPADEGKYTLEEKYTKFLDKENTFLRMKLI